MALELRRFAAEQMASIEEICGMAYEEIGGAGVASKLSLGACAWLKSACRRPAVAGGLGLSVAEPAANKERTPTEQEFALRRADSLAVDKGALIREALADKKELENWHGSERPVWRRASSATSMPSAARRAFGWTTSYRQMGSRARLKPASSSCVRASPITSSSRTASRALSVRQVKS